MIETYCQRCGCQWQPSRAEILAGEWHTCPGCRDGPKPADEQPTDDANHERNHP